VANHHGSELSNGSCGFAAETEEELPTNQPTNYKLFCKPKKPRTSFTTITNSTQRWVSSRLPPNSGCRDRTPGSVCPLTQSTPSPTSEQAARKYLRSTASTTRTQRPRIRRPVATSLLGLFITLKTPSLAFCHSRPAAKRCLAACESTVRMWPRDADRTCPARMYLKEHAILAQLRRRGLQ
jgi:hypothetical protein